MGIAILGPVTIEGAASPLSPRDKVVLAALAIHPGRAVSTDQLADALWGEDTPASSAKVVQGCILRLRRSLGTASIETTTGGYALWCAPDDIDASRFERMIGRARDLAAVGEPDRACAVVDDALALWRGLPLVEVSEWEPGRIEADRLGDLRRDAEDLQIDAELSAGRTDAALAVASARVAEQPLRERRWRQLALAQYRSGRQGDALATLRRARATLADQLGLDPGRELSDLEAAILAQDPALDMPDLPAVDVLCPYPGLVPLDVDDSDDFHGRDREVEECLRRLERDGVVVIVGPSGSGKSSLVRAGVAARLREVGPVVVFTPGARPEASLARALADLPSEPRARTAATLVVDQCEEAVTLTADAAERARFFDALVSQARRGRLVVTLRADRMGDLAAHTAFAALVERHLMLLTGMSDENLRRVIEEPARRAGLLLEPGLVDVLIRDVEGEPGSLPLLAHSLRETWERREGRTLTVAGYRASGGIRAAVAQSAERVYAATSPEQQVMLRELMLRLVRPSDDGEPTRVRASRRSVSTDAEHERLIETLVGARLVTSDDQTVEIAHEALVRAWPRLRDWLAEDADGQRIRGHLTDSAAAWDSLGRPESELYRGIRLAQALDWRERTAAATPVESQFLEAAVLAESASLRRAEHEAQRQRRNNRRLLGAIAGVAALAVATTSFGVVAANEAQRADAAASVARAQELAASAVSALDSDPGLAALLAVSSAQAAEPDLRAAAALHQALAVQHEVSAPMQPIDPMGWLSADVSPDGTRMALGGVEPVGGASRGVEVVDASTAEIAWTERLPDAGSAASAWVVRPLYSPDGRELLWGVIWEPSVEWRIGPDERADAGAPDGLAGIYVRDAGGGAPLQRIDVGLCGGYPLDVSATHILVRTPASAIGGSPGAVDCEWGYSTHRTALELVDRATGARTLLTTDSGHPISQPALSADGRFAAFEDATAGEVRVIDVATGRTVFSRPAGMARDISSDGSLLLAGFDPMQVIDVATGAVVSTLDLDGSMAVYAAFAPGDASVFGSAWDSVLRGWDVATGTAWFRHPAPGVGIVSFAGDGRVGVSYPEAGAVAAVLDPTSRGEFGSVGTCAGGNAPASANAASGTVAFATWCDGDDHATTTLVDVATWRALPALPTLAGSDAALSPDGARIVRVEPGTGTVELPVVRDTATGAVAAALDDPCGAAEPPPVCEPTGAQTSPAWGGTTWSPDGAAIAAIRGDTVAVWDAATGRVRFARAIAAGAAGFDVLFSPDSGKLYVSTVDDGVSAVSAIDGSPKRSRHLDFDGSQFLGLIGFTADSSRLIAVTRFDDNAGAAIVWLDADTFATRQTVDYAHDASLRAASLSPDASQLATSSSDGTARVWDASTGRLLHEIPVGESIEGVAWVGEHRLALAPARGGLLQMSTDPAELLALLRGRVTRGYSLPECDRYGFRSDCPSLIDLGAGPRPDSSLAALNGVYRIDWDDDELRAAMVDHFETITGGGLDDASVASIEGAVPSYTGGALLAFEDGEWEWQRLGRDTPECAGTYRVVDAILRLGVERGSFCRGVTFLEAGYTVDEGGLRLDAETFGGYGMDLVPFTAKELPRVDGTLRELPVADR